MQIPLQNSHAKIMETTVSKSAIPPASSSFCVFVHLMFFFSSICLFVFFSGSSATRGRSESRGSLPVFILAPSDSALPWFTFY